VIAPKPWRFGQLAASDAHTPVLPGIVSREAVRARVSLREDHNYGHTKEGAYICEADAKVAGDRAAMNEQDP
jgi:hypothetical protein